MVRIFDSDFVTRTVYSLYWVDKIDKYEETKRLESWEQEWERQTLPIFLSVSSSSVVFRNQSIILVTCNIDTTWPENISITRCSWNLHNPRTRSEAARRLVSTSKKNQQLYCWKNICSNCYYFGSLDLKSEALSFKSFLNFPSQLGLFLRHWDFSTKECKMVSVFT